MSNQPLLVGYDPSAAASAALDWSAREARIRETELIVAHVIPSAWEWELAVVQINPDRYRAEVRRRLYGPWTAPLRERGVRYRARLVVGRAGPALLRIAHTEDAACIVLGAPRYGKLRRLVHGRIAAHIRCHARRPVIEVPAASMLHSESP